MNDSSVQHDQDPPDPGFAPKDLTDGRTPGDWRSKYEPDAWRHILREAIYLSLVLLVLIGLFFFIWLGYPQRFWHLSDQRNLTLSRYCLAWCSGTLGGVLFAMKWLYHSVAKQLWNFDRCLWRYLTPHISGGLAFATVGIIQSLGVFDPNLTATSAKTVAVGFLVGFF